MNEEVNMYARMASRDYLDAELTTGVERANYIAHGDIMADMCRRAISGELRVIRVSVVYMALEYTVDFARELDGLRLLDIYIGDTSVIDLLHVGLKAEIFARGYAKAEVQVAIQG